MQTHAVSTTEVSSPSDILGGDGVSEDVPDTGVAEVRGRELVIIYALTHYYITHITSCTHALSKQLHCTCTCIIVLHYIPLAHQLSWVGSAMGWILVPHRRTILIVSSTSTPDPC